MTQLYSSVQIVQSQFTELRLHWTFNILKDQSWESKIISPKAKARNKKKVPFSFSLSLFNSFQSLSCGKLKTGFFVLFFYEIQKENSRNEWNGWWSCYYYVSRWDNFKFNFPPLYISRGPMPWNRLETPRKFWIKENEICGGS